MMKTTKILCVLAVAHAPLSIAQTEIQRKVVCEETPRLLAQLSNQYKESPMWIGKLEDTAKYAMFTNPQTKSWTFIQVTPRVSCILALGDDFQQIVRNPL